MSSMITHSNYEEFFLLYVDNELSPADRQIVENFVAANPDLKEEWEALLSCRVKPDNELVFGNMEALLKQKDPQEDPARQPAPRSVHTEDLLSYIDNELDKEGRKAVEASVRLHPSHRRELDALRQTVNHPDLSIHFENKEVLYKKQRDRKIAGMPWLRLAAAAVLLGAIGLLMFHRLRPNVAGELAVAGKKVSAAVTPPRPGTLYHTEQAQQGHTESKEMQTGDGPAAGGQPLAVVQADRHTRRQAGIRTGEQNVRVNKQADAQPQLVPVAPGTDGLQEEPKSGQTPLLAAELAKPANTLIPENKPADRLAVIDPAGAGPSGIHTTSFATQALLNNTTGSREDELARGTGSSGKSKFRGVFRRVSRVFDKTANRDGDDRHNVLIGAFQIAL